LAASTVIVGAHYDHLGIGDPVDGDSIYNGLFDNALGSAVVLELARHLHERSQRPRRSVLFLLFTGEEKGLLGSKVYVSNPSRPLAATSAMINIDGVAGFERFRSVIPVGGGLSTLDAAVVAIAERRGLALDTIPGLFLEGDPLSSSDHWSFIEAGIPSLLLLEGLQYESAPYDEGLQRFVEWGIRAYHQPQDDLRQPVNYEAVAQHAAVLLDLILELANAEVAPEWYPGSPYASARLRAQAEGTK
jgi:Zn-dependent M28 family amino/carboxypeptidase